MVSDSFATPWTVAHQAPLSMEFSMQEYWSGLPFPSPGDLPNPGVKPGLLHWQADSLPFEPPGKPNLSALLIILSILPKIILCSHSQFSHLVELSNTAECSQVLVISP